MAFIFESAQMDILMMILLTAICFLSYFEWSFTYWKKRKVPYLRPSIPWGTLGNITMNPKSVSDMILSQYQEAKAKGHKLVGLFAFSAPVCMILDPLLIRNIVVTDAKSFVDRGIYHNEKDDPLSVHLFTSEGARWKNVRAKLTSTFTSGKIKMMFNIMAESANHLKDAIDKISSKNEPVDIKDTLEKYSTSVIGSAMYGIETNTFTDDDSDFLKYGKNIFALSKFRALKLMIGFAKPDLGRRLGICVMDKGVTDFFQRVFKDTIQYRENKNIKRDDFMQLLINLKNGRFEHDDGGQQQHKHDGKILSLTELSAEAFGFFIGGFDTATTTMSFALFELAVNIDIQDKLRREIQEVLRSYDGKITYEAISDMKYLRKVVDECLRKYPPLPVMNRKCNEDYKIPNTEITIEKGTPIFIPVQGLHHDQEYFSNPEKFDPERFNEENKQNITPYTYIPFGEGPRRCIGMRFGRLQAQIAIMALVQNFKFTVNMKTQMPLKADPSAIVQSALGHIWLNVQKI